MDAAAPSPPLTPAGGVIPATPFGGVPPVPDMPPAGSQIPQPPPPVPIRPAPPARKFPWKLLLGIVFLALVGGGLGGWRYMVWKNEIPIEIEDQPVDTVIRVNKLVMSEPGFLLIQYFDYNEGVLFIASTIHLPPDTYTDFTLKLNESAQGVLPFPSGSRMIAMAVKDLDGNKNLDPGEEFPITAPNGKLMKVEFRVK